MANTKILMANIENFSVVFHQRELQLCNLLIRGYRKNFSALFPVFLLCINILSRKSDQKHAQIEDNQPILLLSLFPESLIIGFSSMKSSPVPLNNRDNFLTESLGPLSRQPSLCFCSLFSDRKPESVNRTFYYSLGVCSIRCIAL